jgi:hypothetical protein
MKNITNIIVRLTISLLATTTLAAEPVRSIVAKTHASSHEYPAGYAEVARHGVRAADFQRVFDEIRKGGNYRLVWIDGYRVNGRNYFNAIFRPSNSVAWSARWGLTADEYQAEFNRQTKNGYRPLQVESYRSKDYQVGITGRDTVIVSRQRYAVIFVKKRGPVWRAYHKRSKVQHQDLFNSLTAKGYRPTNISVVKGSYTALYEKANRGSYLAKSTLFLPIQYQSEFNKQHQAGRKPTYLNAYDDKTEANSLIAAIWTSKPRGAYQARHHLTAKQYQAEWSKWTSRGYVTKAVTGYSSGRKGNRKREALFAAVWVKSAG